MLSRRTFSKHLQLMFFALVLSWGLVAKGAGDAGAEDPKIAEKVKETAKKYQTSDGYVHQWLSLPSITGKNPLRGAEQTYKHKKGHVTVVMFMASWCVPCQLIAPQLQKMEKEFRSLDVDFVYVFSHDTRSDVLGFVREYKLGENVILANDDILKDYHTPPLPTMYLADRHGWMTARKLKVETTYLKKMYHLLEMTSLM